MEGALYVKQFCAYQSLEKIPKLFVSHPSHTHLGGWQQSWTYLVSLGSTSTNDAIGIDIGVSIGLRNNLGQRARKRHGPSVLKPGNSP